MAHLDNKLGVGLIFHITPSNIPTNFAYSFIFGLLTGNSNIVKVPSKNFQDKSYNLQNIKKLLKKNISLKNKISLLNIKIMKNLQKDF